ncbi:hypothetical protein ABT340_14315 [Streptosporangium sp. NPDC000239]|uniref:hypothetical protein n=1 Tax=Streptosporangium sp. NPDC000239 TaxID=3154248 RepID=UPI003324E097
MFRAARAALLAVLPAELLLVVLTAAGVRPPGPVLVVVEVAVVAVLLLEAVTLLRLFRAARRDGAGRRAALGTAVRELVPAPVRRLIGFEARGVAGLLLWVTRRRHGVPPGATAVPYVREQSSMLLVLLFAAVVETVAVELLLGALGVPSGVRTVVLVLDAYAVVLVLALWAACATRPHVVTEGELRVRYGVHFDLRVPRELISSVRLARAYDERGTVTVADGRLGVAVSSQTNVVVELSEPVTVVRPLGRRERARVIRLFADSPGLVLDALRTPVP